MNKSFLNQEVERRVSNDVMNEESSEEAKKQQHLRRFAQKYLNDIDKKYGSLRARMIDLHWQQKTPMDCPQFSKFCQIVTNEDCQKYYEDFNQIFGDNLSLFILYKKVLDIVKPFDMTREEVEHFFTLENYEDIDLNDNEAECNFILGVNAYYALEFEILNK
jgi:hypothetical protein